MDIIHTDINRIKGRHSRPCFRRGKLVPAKAGSGNPGVVPAKAGNQGLAYWIPPYQVRGRLSQARNDKLHNTYMAIYKNQSGAALVIALVMMIILTLIGLASIFTSTFDIKISGNKRGSTDAFYSSDCGVQVIMANVDNFNLTKYNAVTNQYNPLTDPINNNPCNTELSMTYDPAQQGAPRGGGVSALNFEFEHFLVASTGRDSIDINPIRSTCEIREKVVRLVPTLQGGY
jgi:hypothetical protein